jgi:hypothetical protein
MSKFSYWERSYFSFGLGGLPRFIASFTASSQFPSTARVSGFGPGFFFGLDVTFFFGIEYLSEGSSSMRSAGFEPALASQRNRFQVYRVYHFRHDRAPTSHDVGAFFFMRLPDAAGRFDAQGRTDGRSPAERV